MRLKSILKKLTFPILLILAFYLGGLMGTMCENFHESLMLSASVFTATFLSIMAFGTKVYYMLFV